MPRFASETRELEILQEFHRKVRIANSERDWQPVEDMMDEKAILRTKGKVTEGRAAIVELVRILAQMRYKIAVVGPRGGLISVLVSPPSTTRRVEHEQIYRIHNDKIVELIDLGRTPNQVYRLRSQPN